MRSDWELRMMIESERTSDGSGARDGILSRLRTGWKPVPHRGRARRFRARVGLGIMVMICGVVAGNAVAEAPRTRSLSYDASKREWQEAPAPVPGTPEADLHAIRVLIRDGKYHKALSQHKKVVKKQGVDHPLHAELLIAEAEAQVGLKDYDSAHETLQKFLSQYSGMAVTSEALRLEFEVAEAYLGGAKRRVWVIFRFSGVELAYQILDEISTDHPDSSYAELAIKTKADHLFKTGEHSLAEIDYARMLREYPRSRYHQFALRRTADSALASYAGVEYDEAAIIEADERFNDYEVRYPAAAQREGVALIRDSIREMRGEKELLVGQYYERTRHLSSAVFQYRLVRTQYADTIAAAKARRRLELLGASEPVATATP